MRKVDGKLHCDPCGIDLSLRKGTIRTHLFSGRSHATKLEEWRQQTGEDEVIKGIISSYFEANPTATGSSVSTDAQAFRWRVVETFMSAGVPLQKIDKMRTLLEREGHSLTDSHNLAPLFIPLILDYELNRLKEEIAGRKCSFIFDGTTRLGEASNFVIRWIADDFTIQQRLIRLSPPLCIWMATVFTDCL